MDLYEMTTEFLIKDFLVPTALSKKKSSAVKKYSAMQTNPVCKAICKKDYDQLSELLKTLDFDDINCEVDCMGKTALDLAVIMNDHISILLLFTYGAIPDYNRSRNLWSQTTLSWAIQGRDSEVIRILLNHGCDPDEALETSNETEEVLVGPSPHDYWYKVIEQHDLTMFQCMLNGKGRQIRNNEWGRRILLTACGLGACAIVKYLLDQGLPVESADENNQTCVFYAMTYKRYHTIELLINQGANLKHVDSMGRNILHLAVFGYDLSRLMYLHTIFQYLINHGAEINTMIVNNEWSQKILFKACTLGSDKILDYLLNQGVSIESTDSNGWTCIFYAIANRRTSTIKFLINRGANINHTDFEGRTPLHLAVHYDLGTNKYFTDSMDVAQLLIDSGADANAVDINGFSPINAALTMWYVS